MDSLVQPAASIQTNRKDDSDINQNLQTPPIIRNLLSEPTDGAVVGSFRRNNNFRNGLAFRKKEAQNVTDGGDGFLLLVYADWCAHCAGFELKLNRFAKAHPDIPIFVINLDNIGDDAKNIVVAVPYMMGYDAKMRKLAQIGADPGSLDRFATAVGSPSLG
jgi:thiol-disulfide isomerase/thioredoxin